MVNTREEEVMTKFRDKYKELKIETGTNKTVDSYILCGKIEYG